MGPDFCEEVRQELLGCSAQELPEVPAISTRLAGASASQAEQVAGQSRQVETLGRQVAALTGQLTP